MLKLALLLTWLGSWGLHAYVIHRYGLSLPHADEWILTPFATGYENFGWKWIFTPANEHRAPLTRIVLALFGELTHWDWKIIRQLNLAILALSSLALPWAAKKIRGQSHLADAGLIVLALSPAPIESLYLYGYSFVFAQSLIYIAIAMLVGRAPAQGIRTSLLFLTLTLAITFAGGPAGNFVALGLLASFRMLVPRWENSRHRRWIRVGASAIVVSSLAFLIWVPRIGNHVPLRSRDPVLAITNAAKLLISPLGPHWRTALVVLALILFLPIVRKRANSRPAFFVYPLAGSYVALAFVIGIARGKMAVLEYTRYQTFFLPFALLLFLTFLRHYRLMQFPVVISLWVSISMLSAWPLTIETNRTHYYSRLPLENRLREGNGDLSALAHRWYRTYEIPTASDMQWCLEKLREKRRSLFRSSPVKSVSSQSAQLSI